MTPRFHPVDTGARPGDGDLARTLVQGLERPDPRLKPWGALGSLLGSFLSLGALPILLWHDRFRDFVDDERHHFRRFADWLRLHSTRPETMDLRVAGEELGSRPLLLALSMLSVVAVVVLFGIELANGGRPLIDQILAHTYGFDANRFCGLAPPAGQRLFTAWWVGISAAYLFHWLQVQAHASDARRFVRYANEVLRWHRLPRVPEPRVGLGLSFGWLLAAALLATQNAWWGLAVALSGTVQQRYMRDESRRVRRALAARVREMAHLPRGEGTMPPIDELRGRPLGRVLTKMGKVTREQVVDALNFQKGSGLPLGRVLIDRGYVTEADVNFALAAQGAEKGRAAGRAGAATTSARRCPHVRCLATLPGGARFCPRCGHNVNPQPERDSLT